MKTCSVCGRQVKKTVPCPYQRKGLETCPDCCEKCYESEPFPCREHDQRKEPKGGKHMNTIKRGDVFFCLGSPDAVGSEERKTRPVVIVKNDAGNASSPTVIVANMTTNTARRLYPMQFDILLPGRALSRVQCEQIRTVDKCRLRDKVYSLNEDELRKLDDCLAVSFGMARQTAQEGRQDAQGGGDDVFLALAQKGLSVAVCPLPVLNQVNITVTDGKNVGITRNVAAAAGGIIDEIRDMKSTIAEVAK